MDEVTAATGAGWAEIVEIVLTIGAVASTIGAVVGIPYALVKWRSTVLAERRANFERRKAILDKVNRGLSALGFGRPHQPQVMYAAIEDLVQARDDARHLFSRRVVKRIESYIAAAQKLRRSYTKLDNLPKGPERHKVVNCICKAEGRFHREMIEFRKLVHRPMNLNSWIWPWFCPH